MSFAKPVPNLSRAGTPILGPRAFTHHSTSILHLPSQQPDPPLSPEQKSNASHWKCRKYVPSRLWKAYVHQALRKANDGFGKQKASVKEKPAAKLQSDDSARSIKSLTIHQSKFLVHAQDTLPGNLDQCSTTTKCTCPKANDLPCCSKAHQWLLKAYNTKGTKFNYAKCRKQYEELANLPLKGTLIEEASQIDKDLNRTFPLSPYFSDQGPGLEPLRRMLLTFAKYDPRVGYVQGMNFLAATLLYHASEYVAFWLFVALLEDYELRDAFLPGLPGLYKHTQIIDLLIFEHLRDIYKHFCKNSIKVEMFATEWVFTLFTSVIPIDRAATFLDGFFGDSWIFLYKFVIHLLRKNQKNILRSNELDGMLADIRNTSHEPSSSYYAGLGLEMLRSVPLLGSLVLDSSSPVDWEETIRDSKDEKLDEAYVLSMLNCYDLENMRFQFK